MYKIKFTQQKKSVKSTPNWYLYSETLNEKTEYYWIAKTPKGFRKQAFISDLNNSFLANYITPQQFKMYVPELSENDNESQIVTDYVLAELLQQKKPVEIIPEIKTICTTKSSKMSKSFNTMPHIQVFLMHIRETSNIKLFGKILQCSKNCHKYINDIIGLGNNLNNIFSKTENTQKIKSMEFFNYDDKPQELKHLQIQRLNKIQVKIPAIQNFKLNILGSLNNFIQTGLFSLIVPYLSFPELMNLYSVNSKANLFADLMRKNPGVPLKMSFNDWINPIALHKTNPFNPTIIYFEPTTTKEVVEINKTSFIKSSKQIQTIKRNIAITTEYVMFNSKCYKNQSETINEVLTTRYDSEYRKTRSSYKNENQFEPRVRRYHFLSESELDYRNYQKSKYTNNQNY